MKSTATILPIPKRTQTRSVQVGVNEELFTAVSKEAKKHKLSMRLVVEWGLKNFLISTNADEAIRLGLVDVELKTDQGDEK